MKKFVYKNSYFLLLVGLIFIFNKNNTNAMSENEIEHENNIKTIVRSTWDQPWDDQIPASDIIQQHYPQDSLRLEVRNINGKTLLTTYEIDSQSGKASPIFQREFSALELSNKEAFISSLPNLNEVDILFKNNSIALKNINSQKSIDIIAPKYSLTLYSLATLGDFRVSGEGIMVINPNISVQGSAVLSSIIDTCFHDYNGIKKITSSLVNIQGDLLVDTHAHDFYLYGCKVSTQGDFIINARDAIFDVAIRETPKSKYLKPVLDIGQDMKVDLTGNLKARFATFTTKRDLHFKTRGDIICHGTNTTAGRNVNQKATYLYLGPADGTFLYNFPILYGNYTLKSIDSE